MPGPEVTVEHPRPASPGVIRKHCATCADVLALDDVPTSRTRSPAIRWFARWSADAGRPPAAALLET